jgi:nucleotide-binding universal stress UspA family protein
MTEQPAPVVVGISRHTGSPEALMFAIQQAQLLGAPVLAITAWRPPRPVGAAGGKPLGMREESPTDIWVAEQDRLAARLEDHIGKPLAEADVTFELRRGQPAAVLLDAAHAARLLVLDSPRAGNLTTIPKSWIAPEIIFRADCPVVVMPAQRASRLRDRLLTAAGTAGRPGIRVTPPPT